MQNSVFSSELSVDGGSGIVINHNDFSYPVQSTNGGPNAKIYLDTSGGSPGSAVTVENNVIENGDLDGVHVAGGSGMLIFGNVIANLCDRGVNHTDDIQFEGGSQIRVANNYVYEAQNCPTQGITAYDGNTHGLMIDDNVVDVPRDWGIELYSDSGSTVVHNTVVWHPNTYSEFNTPTGQIDIDRKSQDPAGSGTQVYDNIASVDFSNGSTGTAHNNVSGQRAVYVGPTNTWAGFKLAANSPVGLKAASDGLDAGIRVTVAPNAPPAKTTAPGKGSPSKGGGSNGGKGGSRRAAAGLAVTGFRFSPASFHALAGHAARNRRHGRGTAIMFHLSRRATVKISIARALRGRRAGGRCVKPKRALRRHAACIRFKRTGTLVHTLKGGKRAIPYRGRSTATGSGGAPTWRRSSRPPASATASFAPRPSASCSEATQLGPARRVSADFGEPRGAQRSGRNTGPDLVRGHRGGHHRAHADDRAGADGDALADQRARAEVGAGLDGHAAGHPHAGSERGPVADHVVVGEHDRRHHRDVRTEPDVGGQHGGGMQDRARADHRRFGTTAVGWISVA